MQFLPASLTGSALVAYSSGRMASDSDLSSVLNAMSAQCQSSELSLREFYSLTWETGQSIDDYLFRLQQCLDTAKLSSLGHDTREELLIQKFISGRLPREVQMAFEMQTSRLPLQQCVHLARRMVRKPLNPTYSERPLRTFQANSRRCFQCGQLGHIARDCSVNACITACVWPGKRLETASTRPGTVPEARAQQPVVNIQTKTDTTESSSHCDLPQPRVGIRLNSSLSVHCCLVDTGSAVSLLPRSLVSTPLDPVSDTFRLEAASGTHITSLGEQMQTCVFRTRLKCSDTVSMLRMLQLDLCLDQIFCGSTVWL